MNHDRKRSAAKWSDFVKPHPHLGSAWPNPSLSASPSVAQRAKEGEVGTKARPNMARREVPHADQGLPHKLIPAKQLLGYGHVCQFSGHRYPYSRSCFARPVLTQQQHHFGHRCLQRHIAPAYHTHVG